MRKLIILLVLSVFLVPISSEAAPVSVNCPGSSITTDREFTLTTDPTAGSCLMYGNDPNQLNANAGDLMLAAGWDLIDKDTASNEFDSLFSVTGMGLTSGTFTLSSSLWTIYNQIAIGFVVGGGQIDPKWAVFLLPSGETTGLWANAPPQGGGLSHVNLYGMGTPSTPVPEPASLLLFGTGLTAIVRRMRAKR